ncbi:hypothetical protein SUGI_1035760 [Cryptomeria japonica]|nr:hypothetical protein SUGI_1035760 [Cryptomeria japonica]
MVKIWKWLKRSRRSRGYTPLQMQDRKSRKIKRPLRMGGSKSGGGYLKCQASDSFNNGGESCVSLLHSPQNRAKENRRGRQFHLPHLELQRLKNFQWNFHLPHIGHGERNSPKHVPKGCLAVYVGQGEEPHRFVVPAVYFNHPLFGELLKEAEEKYGFKQTGPINIPCQVSDFENVKRQIHTECSQKH